MAKPRSATTDYLVYLAFRIGVCVLQALPPDLACRFADVLMAIIYRLDRRHREVTIDNLRHAFPGQHSDRELHEMAFEVYRHFAAIILAVMLMPRKLTLGNWRRHVNADAYVRLKAAIDTGRPVIVLTAHFGNWELAAHCLGLAGIRSHLVARPLDNPYLDKWVRSIRELTGHRVLSKTGDVRRMNEVLSANETICTLGDQDAGENGMFVDFFGRPASAYKAIARLSQRTGAVIAVCGMQKTGGLLEYTLRVVDIIRPEEYGDDADATLAITQRYTAAVEAMVRLDPVQYFWLHRRWKHQPPESQRKKAA